MFKCHQCGRKLDAPQCIYCARQAVQKTQAKAVASAAKRGLLFNDPEPEASAFDAMTESFNAVHVSSPPLLPFAPPSAPWSVPLRGIYCVSGTNDSNLISFTHNHSAQSSTVTLPFCGSRFFLIQGDQITIASLDGQQLVDLLIDWQQIKLTHLSHYIQ